MPGRACAGVLGHPPPSYGAPHLGAAGAALLRLASGTRAPPRGLRRASGRAAGAAATHLAAWNEKRGDKVREERMRGEEESDKRKIDKGWGAGGEWVGKSFSHGLCSHLRQKGPL
jgi:hypothetical protein